MNEVEVLLFFLVPLVGIIADYMSRKLIDKKIQKDIMTVILFFVAVAFVYFTGNFPEEQDLIDRVFAVLGASTVLYNLIFSRVATALGLKPQVAE